MNATVAHVWQAIVSAREDILGILLLLTGVCAGIAVGIMSVFLWKTEAVIFTVNDAVAPVPTVIIEAAPTGRVEGGIHGDARVLLGNDLVAQGSGAFAGVMQGSLPVVVEIRIPAGMKYVASRTGKKYYDVTSAMGNRLLPKNRVYFPDRASAERAGYKP